MKKLWVVIMMSTALAPLTLPSPVQAQWGGGGRGTMRNNPKMRLSGLVRSFGMLERGGKAPLSPTQAKAIMASINPWRTRPTMNESQAKSLYIKLNSVLTTRQKNELDKRAAQNRRFGGAPGAGAGGWRREGNGGGPSDAERQQMRARMQQMQGFFKTYNPFYPPAKYRELKGLPARMQESYQRRYASQQAMLNTMARKARS